MVSRITFYRDKLLDSLFIKNLSVLMAGTALSNLFIFATTPILTRLYTPAEFGSLSVFLSLVYTLQIIASFRYDAAIPLPEKREDAYHLFILSTLFVILVSILTLTIIVLFPVAELFSVPELANYMWLLAASVMGIGFYQVWNLWAIRMEEYHSMSRAKVMMNSGQVVSQIAFGVMGAGVFGLIIGEVIGRFYGTFSYVKNLKNQVFTDMRFQKRKMFEVMKRYKSFPLISSWSSLLGGLGDHLPVFFLAMLFDAKTVGLYFLAQKILTVPEGMLGFSASQVYLSHSAQQSRKSFAEFQTFFWGSMKKIILLATLMVGLVVLLAPPLVSFVFGEEWIESGKYIQILAVFFLTKIIVSPITANFYVFEALKIQLLAEFLRFICIVIALVFAAHFSENPTISILLISLVSALGYLIYGFFAWYVMKRNYDLLDKIEGS